MPSNYHHLPKITKQTQQRTQPLTKHTVLCSREVKEYCTITIWFISNMYLWDTHSHSHSHTHTLTRNKFAMDKTTCKFPDAKKRDSSEKHRNYVDHFLLCCRHILAALFVVTVCRCSCIVWHWLLSSISLSSLTLTLSVWHC